jgi:hypothetical protein
MRHPRLLESIWVGVATSLIALVCRRKESLTADRSSLLPKGCPVTAAPPCQNPPCPVQDFCVWPIKAHKSGRIGSVMVPSEAAGELRDNLWALV